MVITNSIAPIKPEQEPQKIEDIFAQEAGQEKIRPEVRETRPDITKEAAGERRPEHPPTPATEEEARRRYAPSVAKPVAGPAAVKSPEVIQIETILSENLDELFLRMTPAEQLAFKLKGEETAGKIEKLLLDAKVRVKDILNAIKEWLKLIPGVNKFFLEQEAKIKTDRVLASHEQKNKRR